MSKVQPVVVSPLERLARRICMAANARPSTMIANVVDPFKQRAQATVVDAALELAVAKQWLRVDGENYVLTQAGTALGSQSRRGPRTKRVSPF